MGIRRLIAATDSNRFLLERFKIKTASQIIVLTTNSIRGKLADSIPQTTVPTYKSWSVVKIADGDTIRQAVAAREKIRFCGVDAVEADQKLGPQAADYLRSLIGLGDGTVLVTPIEKDRYERTVAELFVKPRPGIPGYQPEEEIFLNGENGGSLTALLPTVAIARTRKS